MKKLLYTIIALAATVFTVGCQRETRIEEEGTVEASFNIGFAGTQTKAVSDGLTATQLVVGVYDKALGFVQSQSWLPTSADHKNAFSALKATFNTRLVKGHGYDIVFLAVAPDNGFYTIDLENKSLSVAKTGDSNAEKRDAFYAVYSISKVTDAINESDIVLTRPFAQINVLDIKEDFLAAKEALVNFKKSALTVKAPTKMNLIDGSVSDADTYVLAKAEMSSTTPNFEPYGARGDYWLLTDYILASNTKELADLSFTLYDEADAEIVSYDLTSVPYQRNFRTNIYGGLLTTDGTFVITIDPVYEGSVEFPIEGKVPAVTFANTELSAAGGALTTDVDGTINFKATHPMATVPVTYKSSNVAVGTIDANGLFTAKAAGNTVVTVSFPAVENGVVKSADDTYSSLTVTFTVTVKAAELADAELTVSGAPTAALAAGESFNLTVASKSDGAITVTADPKDAVTVGAPASGVYAVTAAELSADTEVTLTVSQAATTVYNASTKTVKFTVSKKEEVVPPTPATGKTIAELKALITGNDTKFEEALTLGTVVVTAVKGSNVWLEDESGAVLLYLKDNGLVAGKSYTGAKVSGGTFYNTLYEITTFDVTDATVADATIPVTEITVAQLLDDFTAYESRRVKLTGVTVTNAVPGTDKTVPVSQGDKATNLYVRYEQSFKAQSVLNVVGNVSKYSGNAQIAVFAAEDVTVVSEGKTTATIAFPAGAASIEVGSTKAFAATTNSDATITYTSDNTAVATIAADGTISAVAEGTAKVTASVAETTTFTAASVTATITVTAVGQVVEYETETIAGNFAAEGDDLVLTTESGITIRQKKNSGTQPNANYATATTLRVYIGNSLVFSGKTITKIEFTNTAGYAGGTDISANVGTFTRQANAVWEGEAAEIEITNLKGSSDESNIQFRPTAIKVTYVK